MTTAALFTFRNEFDDVTVSLDNDSPHPTGPYTVRVEFGDAAISNENTSKQFATLAASMEEFFALIKNEVRAVLDDGTFR